jgi:hypothetical protein
MEIKNSTDWHEVQALLLTELYQIGYNPDFRKLIRNIALMVSNLSKAEVEARRIHNDKNLVEPLDQINKSIKHLKHLLLMARLMK